MKNALISDARLNNCVFNNTDLRNLDYGRFPDFIGHTGDVYSIAFSPDGNYLLSGSSDSTIKLWSTETQKLILTMQGHSDYIRSVAFSSQGKCFASGSRDCTIKLWSIYSPRA
jgi:WD40 repeat protein